MGDPSGIGPEVIAKSLSKASIRRLAKFIIVGDYGIYRRYSSKHFDKCTFIDLKNISPTQFHFGKSNAQSAKASLEYLKEALGLIMKKEVNALVTAPVSKEAICAIGEEFHGHTEYIANYFGIKNFAMMFVAHALKTVVVTRHIPLKEVSRAVSPKRLYDTIVLTADALKRNFRIKHPSIAVCGMNPHAGEQGTIGTEEIITISPAIQRLKRKGLNIFGPFSADTLFYPPMAKKYDSIVAMYHDQGLIPIKTLYFNKLVNLTLGLPFIRTSPAHGTAFDIVGKNKADPSSMIEAIKLAVQLS